MQEKHSCPGWSSVSANSALQRRPFKPGHSLQEHLVMWMISQSTSSGTSMSLSPGSKSSAHLHEQGSPVSGSSSGVSVEAPVLDFFLQGGSLPAFLLFLFHGGSGSGSLSCPGGLSPTLRDPPRPHVRTCQALSSIASVQPPKWNSAWSLRPCFLIEQVPTSARLAW